MTREELMEQLMERYIARFQETVQEQARLVYFEVTTFAPNEARKKAQQLLRDVIGEERWAEYQENASFFVTSQYGHKYRIVNGYANNIIMYETPESQEPAGTLCCHPSVYCLTTGQKMPVEDLMVGQYLAITANERAFLELANTHGVPSWFESTLWGWAA